MSDDGNSQVLDEEMPDNLSEEDQKDEKAIDDHPEMWKDPRVENIVRAIRKNEKAKDKNEIIKVNYKVLIDPKTKLIAPLVTLLGTAVVAVFTYFDKMPAGRWFVVVCATLVLFLLIGYILQNMVEKFEEEAVRNWIGKRLEQERLKDEEKARQEAEEFVAKATAAPNEEEDLFF